MSDALADLYQDVVLDHGKQPRNFRRLEGATATVDGVNPLCGDRLTLYVKLVDGVIEDLSFEGAGCAISRASASLMTAALKGMRRDEALVLFGRVHDLLTAGPRGAASVADVGKLAALSGVCEFPMRVKCATLAWHALREALASTGTSPRTE